MQLEYFRMIDEVAHLEDGHEKILCRSTVPQHSPIFEGHFPGHALMPGVLLIETMAQASGYLILKRNGFSQMAFFIAADKVKLRQFVVPGECLDISATLQHEGSGYAVTTAHILRQGVKICDAELKFRLMDFPNAELKNTMQQQAQRIGLPE